MFRILNSPDGQQLKAKKPEVWQDGKIHYLAHIAAAQQKGFILPPPLAAPPPPLPKPGASPTAPPHGAPGATSAPPA
jgi:hypothetical protein